MIDCNTKSHCNSSHESRFLGSNHLCSKGYIGARCGSCDNFGEYWNDHYAL